MTKEVRNVSSAERGESELSLPLWADPAAGALIGTVVLFTLLLLPVSLIVLFVALIVIGVARSSRSQSTEPKADPELAARFRDLEDSISGSDDVK